MTQWLKDFHNNLLPTLYYNTNKGSKIALEYLTENKLLNEIKLNKNIPQNIKNVPAIVENDIVIVDKLLINFLRELKQKKDAWAQKDIFDNQNINVKQSFSGNYVPLDISWQKIYAPTLTSHYNEPTNARYMKLMNERKKII